MDLPLSLRIRPVNDAPVRQDGGFVLYWMIAARRASHNFALDRAIDWSASLGRPLVVLEALRSDYRWASTRLHRFVIEGMRDNAAAFAGGPALYYPYVEPARGSARGLLETLGESACVVVTDDFPCFFLPHMVASAGRRVTVRLEAVDSNGLLPIRLAGKAYPAAVHFRRHLQKHVRTCLREFPRDDPFAQRAVPPATALELAVCSRWPVADFGQLLGSSSGLRGLPIDHVVPSVSLVGGSVAGRERLRQFAPSVAAYDQVHSHPDDEGTSGLSPYLHFGHVSAHEVFTTLVRAEHWSLSRLGTVSGSREGFWGVSRGLEAFLDQLLTWRELGLNTCTYRPADYDRFSSLPDWARHTLERHAGDSRPFLYSQDQFENAETHDPLWNAAQRQLREEGWMHNYLRMLWGKKILEWSPSPEQALTIMKDVMDRWAVDGRDPNSYAGYCWTLGRYDRPWPERPVYGTVRSMSSENTRRKVRVKRILERYGGLPPSERAHQARLLTD